MTDIRTPATIGAAFAVGLTAGLLLSEPDRTASPTIRQLQAAYDREAVVAGETHDKGLTIVGLECSATESGKYACQVGFTKAEEGDRIFLDAALVQKSGTREWRLLRGLCKRLL